ncbi:hypothetical protein GQX74_009711 [Glossina fuscipes]|nr:hypothetical protein GQX74_009711 [Glossina fuscipes]
MNTKSCMSALRKFIARIGIPAIIISDYAKRVNLGVRRLEQLLKSSEVQDMATNQNITWKFILDRAAWWGGYWERLVRSTKYCLKAAIGKAKLTLNDLTTLLAEAESIVNTRRTTYVVSDHNGLEASTSPQFLTYCKCIVCSRHERPIKFLYPLKKSAAVAQNVLDNNFSVHEKNVDFILFGPSQAHSEALLCRIDIGDLADIQQMVSDYQLRILARSH